MSTEPLSSPENYEDVRKLCKILVGLTPEELRLLQERINNPNIRAKDVGEILAEAVRCSTSIDDRLSKNLAPIVEGGVNESIRKNPKEFSDILAPIMGPAIRASIVNTIREYINSIDRVLQNSMSSKGIFWRIEALRTGRSFAEIALYHSLQYRIEHVFIIDKKTSVPLCKVSAPGIAQDSPEAITGMLSAISEFVNESFNVGSEQGLGRMEVGELNVLLCDGSKAILAAVVRGETPEGFRDELLSALDSFHLEYPYQLENFSGDTLEFSLFEPRLEDLLKVEFKEGAKKKSSPVRAILFVAAILGVLGYFLFQNYREEKSWAEFTNYLDSLPGVIVTDYEKSGDLHQIRGLRDPLAIEPSELFEKQELAGIFVPKFHDYISLEPEIAETRIFNILNAPESVTLDFSPSGKLTATGVANSIWITKFINVAPSLPGVTQVDSSQLSVANQELFDLALKKLMQIKIDFAVNSATLTTLLEEEQEKYLDRSAKLMAELEGLAKTLGKDLTISINMHSAFTGTDRINETLSEVRYNRILKELLIRDVSSSLLSINKWKSDDNRICSRFPKWCNAPLPIIYFDIAVK